MNYSNFRKILLKALKEIETDILIEMPDISPEKMGELLALAKNKILLENNISPEDFADYENSLKEIGKEKGRRKKEELTKELTALEERVVSKIPPEKEIPAPQIIHNTQIVKEVLKPQIIKTIEKVREVRTEKELDRTQLEEIGQNLFKLQGDFLDLYNRVGQIKIPEIPDYNLIKGELEKYSADHISGLWGQLPDYRMALMGLRGDIDKLRTDVNNISPTESDPVAMQYLNQSVKTTSSPTFRQQTLQPITDIPGLIIKRGTDTNPTGNLIEIYKADGVTLLASMAYDGRWRLGLASTAPTIAAGTGAGTTPTVAIAGSDSAGEITITTGASPSASATIVTITLSRAFTNAPAIILTPSNANAAALTGATQIFATSTTTTFLITSGSTGLTASTQYKWMYHALGN